MAGTANSITSHNSLRGVLNANNVIAGEVGTAFDSTYSVTAETGAQIALSISSTDYKMQATLKDKYGNIIYTSNIIDLPLETMVVNARYDKDTKEVVLILDNGNELRFSVADLVEGLISTDQLNSILTDYVKFTDYAGTTKAGVVKISDTYAIAAVSGVLTSQTKTYTQYDLLDNNAFISKGTLENVIAEKELVNKTYVDEADAVFENKLFGDNNVEGNGTELTINNTTEAPMGLVYKGNTYQDSTSGKNLMPNNATTQTIRGITFTINDDKSITLNGTNDNTGSSTLFFITEVDNFSLPAGTYYSIATGVAGVNIGAYDGTKYYTFAGGSGNSITLQNNVSFASVYLQISKGNSTTFNNKKIYPIFSLTPVSESDYEPYTNGASPNPDYPQNIHVVSGDNSIVVCGKNLFDESVEKKSAYPTTTIGSVVSYVNSSASSSYVNCCYLEAGTTYTFSCKLNTPASITYRDSVIVDKNNIVLEHFYLWNNTTSHTYTPTHSGYLILCVDNNSTELMIEKNNEATTYEAYKGASYPINLGDKELCKIGTYQDKIDKSSGKNLLDLNRTLGQPSDTTASNATKRKFNYNEVVKGISGNNYYYPQFVSSYSIENQTISITTGATATYSLGFPIKIKANTTYTMSFDKNNTSGRVQVSYYTSDGTYLNYESKTASFTFTTPSNCDFILINFTGIEVNTTYTFTNCMLNEGTTILPYEPYGTGWYVKKEIGKVVLDGTQNIATVNWKPSSTSVGWFYPYSLTNNKVSTVGTVGDIIADKLIATDYRNLYDKVVDSGIGLYTTKELGIIVRTSDTTLITETLINTYLASNPITVYYAYDTPTYTLIEDTTLINQLETIKKSCEGQTNISQNNDDLPFELNISAVSGNLSGIRLLLEAKEDKSNKVAVINEYSTDEQYPTAKCVYELVGNVESILEILDIGDGVYAGGGSV